MKVAICSQGPELDSLVDPRVGRCAYFVLVNDDLEKNEAFPNPSVGASGGAGVQTAQFLMDKGVDAVLVGNIGPNALAALTAGGIKIYSGISGTVADTFKQYQQGELSLVSDSTVPPNFGLGGGGGGRGGGAGRGRGGGRGGGGGFGRF